MSDKNKLEAPEADEYVDENYGEGEDHSEFGEEYGDPDEDEINQNPGEGDSELEGEYEEELELEPDDVAPAKDKKNKMFNMVIAIVSLFAVILVGAFAYVTYSNNVAKKERAKQTQAQVERKRESQQETPPAAKEGRPAENFNPMVEMPTDQPKTPIATQVSTPSSSVAETSVASPFSEASSEVVELVETHERKITKIAEVMVQAGSEIKDLKEQLAAANERISAMEAQLKANEKKIASNKKAASASSAKVTSSRGSAGVAVAKQHVLKGYNVESMFDNKAWITYKGKRHVVTIGDSIPGAGKVVTINLNTQNVTTTRGIIQ